MISRYTFNKDFLIRRDPDSNEYLLMNIVSGDLFKINEKIKNFLENLEKIKNISRKEINFLISQQIILRDSEKVKYEKIKQFKRTKNGTLFHLQWHITTACNLRCKHCYQKEYDQSSSLVEMKRVVDKYFEAIDKWGSFPEISLTGGEPFLNNDLFNIIKYIRKKQQNCGITILTNGTLINEKNVMLLKKFRVAIQVSLEGPSEEINDSIRGRGSFEKILYAIRLLKKNRIPVSIHFVISNFNKDYILDTIDLCTKEKVDMFSFSRYVPISPNEKLNEGSMLNPNELKSIYSRVHKKAEFLNKNKLKPHIMRQRTLWCNFKSSSKRLGGGCSVGETLIVVMPDGTVYPCRRLPISIGNIKNESFFKIWYSSDLLWQIRNKNSINGCSKCKHKNICAGCRAIAYSKFNDYLEKDPQCWKV